MNRSEGPAGESGRDGRSRPTDSGRRRRPRARHIIHAIALVAGIVALSFLIDRLGWSGIEAAIVRTGPWFAVIAAIDLAALCCDAAGVHRFLRPIAPISYPRVLAAQASGLAINRLTPGNSLGEPVKVTMLMAHVPEAAAVSAVVMFNVGVYVVAICVIVIGVPLTLLTLDLPARLDAIVLVLTAVLAVAIVGLIVLARRGALASVIAAVRRLHAISPERAARWTKRMSEIDTNVRRFGDRTTRSALAFVVVSRLLNMTGSIVILVAAEIPITAPLVIGLLSVGILITWLSNLIPLGLGLADGSNYLLYRVLGSSPELGVDFTMINRVRTVLLASMGLAIMALANLIDAAQVARSR